MTKLATLILATTLTFAQPLLAQESRPYLTTESAQKIIEGCLQFAKQNKINISIAVMDRGKDLVAFIRTNETPVGINDIALWKARAASSLAAPSKEAAERAKKFPAVGFAPNIAIYEGGEPIFTQDGIHIGGVGVSGASGADDIACGHAGIKAANLKATR